MSKRTQLTRRNFIWVGTAFAAATQFPNLAWSVEGDILKIRSYRDIQVLDPAFMLGSVEIEVQYACLASLAVDHPGETLSWKPSAFVQKVEQTDDLHITFELKPGIQWSGGFGELTAEDVKFSFERIADPKNKSPWKDKWATLQDVQITGPYSGVIVLKQAFAPIWFTAICDGVGSIVCKKAVEAKGGKFTSEFPAVCGPYQIKHWSPKQRLELERNPLWKGDKPDFAEVHMIFIEDVKSAEDAFEAGDVDFTAVSLDSLPRYKQHLPDHSKLYEGPGTAWTWMGMNTEHPRLKDIRVRQAIQNAVDCDSIINAAYGGVQAARARGIVTRGLPGYRTHTAFEKPNLGKAKALLREAGVSNLSLDLDILNSTVNLTTAQIIQANLAAIGIKIQIIPLDSGPFFNLGQESQGQAWKGSQLWIMKFFDAPDPSQMTQWYVSSQVGVWNWERWKSVEFDDLNKKALVEQDPSKRAAMYIRMQDIMEDTGAYVWVAQEPVEIIYRDSIVIDIVPPDHPYVAGFRTA